MCNNVCSADVCSAVCGEAMSEVCDLDMTWMKWIVAWNANVKIDPVLLTLTSSTCEKYSEVDSSLSA